MMTGFNMNRKSVRLVSNVIVDYEISIFDHQMQIHLDRDMPSQCRHHLRTERHRGHKPTIHYIYVNPVAPCLNRSLTFAPKVREIRRKN